MLVFFKISHYMDYTPGENKEYQFIHPENNLTLKLTHHEN
jgi:hypothetical protein